MTSDLAVDLSGYIRRARTAQGPQVEGRISEVIGQLVLVEGVSSAVGGQLETRVGSKPMAL